jgi:hypothetical protein
VTNGKKTRRESDHQREVFRFVLARGSIVIKVFNHWFHRKTVAQVAVDLMFPVVCVILAAMWIGGGGQLELDKDRFLCRDFRADDDRPERWLGIYQRVHDPHAGGDTGTRRLVAVPGHSAGLSGVFRAGGCRG